MEKERKSKQGIMQTRIKYFNAFSFRLHKKEVNYQMTVLSRERTSLRILTVKLHVILRPYCGHLKTEGVCTCAPGCTGEGILITVAPT